MDIQGFIDGGVIEAHALRALIESGETKVKILDGSFAHPSAAETPYQIYKRKHIPGAGFFDIKEAADKSSDLPHMIPTPEVFEAYVSGLGIDNDDLVVVYGQSGIVMGPARVWWLFRLFGHDRVCLLNGGLHAWEDESLPLNNEAPPPPEKTDYSAAFRPELVKNLSQVQAAVDGEEQILDARPRERFTGQAAEPRSGMRSGHIPGSQNLPCIDLINSNTGKLKPKEEISAIFDGIGLDYSAPALISCGSGVTACVIALALFHLGYKDIPVYDGSWSEWGRESSPTDIA